MRTRSVVTQMLSGLAFGLLGAAACSSPSDAGLFEQGGPGPTTAGVGGRHVGGRGGGGGDGGTVATAGSSGSAGQITTGGQSGAGGGMTNAGAGGGGLPDGGLVGQEGGVDSGPAVVCQPAAPLCADNVATTCNADGTGPDPAGTDCTLQGATCVDGSCVPSCPVATFGCSCDQGGCDTGLVCSAESLCETKPPVAHWRFEDDATDSSGNGYDGVEQNGVDYTDGVDGRAARFNRNDDTYVDIDSFSSTFSTITSGFSLFIRVRLDAYSPGDVHVLFGMGSPGEIRSTNEFRFVYEDGVQIETETGFGENHLTRLGDIPSEDVWHDLVFVVDGATVTYYLDGTQVSEETFTLSDTTSTSMVIGGWQDGHALEGAIDDVRVWDTLLSAEQVAEL